MTILNEGRPYSEVVEEKAGIMINIPTFTGAEGGGKYGMGGDGRRWVSQWVMEFEMCSCGSVGGLVVRWLIVVGLGDADVRICFLMKLWFRWR